MKMLFPNADLADYSKVSRRDRFCQLLSHLSSFRGTSYLGHFGPPDRLHYSNLWLLGYNGNRKSQIKVMNTVELTELKLAEHQLAAIKEASRVLQDRFPVQEVRLFGSFARGEGQEDSDLDLFVLTTRQMSYREKAAMSDAVFEINLQYGVVIHLLIASTDEWKSPVWSQLPVYQDIRKVNSLVLGS